MKHIQYVVEQGVATLTLGRPAQKNAMNPTLLGEIGEAVAEVSANPEVRALIITGAGGHFCSGGDLQNIEASNLDGEAWRERLRKDHVWLEQLIQLDRPVIAAVDGVAIGAGFSLALSADFILATPRARFSMSFLRIGGIPGCGALYTLPRIVGQHRAKEIMLSARQIAADEARALGIVFEICEVEGLQARAQTLARSFVNAPAAAIAMTKRGVGASIDSDLKSMLEFEANAQALAFGTAYHRDAVARFGRKEAPRFQWPEAV